MASSRTLHPNIHRLIGSQALSKLGDNFTEVALALFILALTHNVADLGLVLAMAYLPRLALGWAVAGVIDRLPKRRTLLLSDIIRALLIASIPLVRDFLWTVIAVFLMYTFAMVYQPILRSIQPQIAGDATVNAQSAARQETYYAVADMGAYLLAAAVIFLWGIAPAFWINAATFVGAAFLIAGIRVSPDIWAPLHQGTQNFWRQIREGLSFIRNHPTVKALTIVSTTLSMGVGSLNTLLAPLSRGVWHVSSAHYVWLVLAMALGAFVSGSLLERYRILLTQPSNGVLAAGFLLTALGFGLVLLLPTWEWGAMSLLLVGAGNAVFGSSVMLWVQQETPTEARARVLALRGVGLGVGGALGSWLGGLLAHDFGLSLMVAAVAMLWIGLAVGVVLHPSLRKTRSEISAA